jgi:hypothetical protein
LFVAGFLLFLIVFGGLLSAIGPLVALAFGAAEAAVVLFVVGLAGGFVGGVVCGALLAGMGRTKTILLSTRGSSVAQLAHDFLARRGYTVFSQAPPRTTYCALAAAQAYAQATAPRHLSIRLFRFVGEKLCGIVPTAFYVHVTEREDGLQVSGPAPCVHDLERELRPHGVVASQPSGMPAQRNL